MEVKRKIINLIFRAKYIRKHLQIGKSAYIYGINTYFEGFNKIGASSKFQGYMGYGSYIGESSHINATIGRYSCIGDRVHTISGTHPTREFVSIHPAFYSTAKQAGFTYIDDNCFEERHRNPVDGKTTIYIGNDVWIGSNVTILGGIIIGDGAIVAAGALINQDVEPYTIVGGVPAKVIRKRFRQEEISFLQEFCWWNMKPEWLKENSKNMKNIKIFMEKYFE